MLARRLLALVALLTLGTVVWTAGPVGAQSVTTGPSSVTCPWVDSTQPVSNRVAEVLGQMTQAQKLSMIHGIANPNDLQLTGPVYAGIIPGIRSLCLPSLGFLDGPAGVGDGLRGVTQLPAPESVAATFDPGLAGLYGVVVGAEVRGKGAAVSLGPTVNIVRDPRWGREFESLGEDPYLTSQIADAEIEGIQSQDVIAQVKHFAVYNQETFRDSAADDALVSVRTMEEIYLPAFESAVEQAHVGSVMCAYSTIDGTPACGDGFLMNQMLKEAWGFEGFVTSDWFATKAGAPDADAGLDVEMPDQCYFSTALGGELANGEFTESRLDDMVSRVLRSEFALGVIDHPPTGNESTVVTSPTHTAVATAVAEDGTVLLQNTGNVLPLAPSVHSIAVIGTDATGAAQFGGTGSASVIPSSVSVPLQAITARAGSGVKVTYNPGTSAGAAAAAARAANVAIVFAGVSAGEGQDLTSIDLPQATNQMIDAVSAANPRTVVVLNTGNPVAMPWVHQVASVLEAWYPGQVDGSAIAAILFGDVDPSGKLPVTFPVSLTQVPASTPSQWPGLGTVSYSEGLDVGYRWYEAMGDTPLFPFGYGLSYTSFTFSGLSVTPSGDDGAVSIALTLTNTGTRAGSDVVQSYVSDPAVAGEPPRQLKAFERVTLDPGHSSIVHLSLNASALSYWDDGQNRWVAPAGLFTIHVGDSSVNLPLSGTYTLTKTLETSAPIPPAPGTPPVSASELASETLECPADAIIPTANGILTILGID